MHKRVCSNPETCILGVSLTDKTNSEIKIQDVDKNLTHFQVEKYHTHVVMHISVINGRVVIKGF